MIHISKSIMNRMINHATKHYPFEVCGLLGGIDRHVLIMIPVTNIYKSPTEFRMKPEEQLRGFIKIETAGYELMAIYHSHPNGPENPSQKDLETNFYPDTYSLILSRSKNAWKIRAFRLEIQNYVELPIVIK